jgi:putative aminopeptidase FrvX
MFTVCQLRALLLTAVPLWLYLPGYAQKQTGAQSLPASVQLSPGVVVVTYQDGELTIQALNAPLTRVLQAASIQMGTIIDLPSGTDEAVVGEFGPGRPTAVIAALLNGSHFNYVMTASVADPNRPERVVLTLRPDAGEEISTRASFQQ